MNFRKFMKEVEGIINNDNEIIKRAKKCNQEFAEKVEQIMNDEESKLFIGSMIAELQFQSNRYSYIKNLEFQGKEYTAEIDELERKFYLIES